MKKRLRKKKRLGEFQELTFLVGYRASNELDKQAVDELIDRFIEEVIEENGLGFFGGGRDFEFGGFVVTEKDRGTVSEEQKESVKQWFIQESEILGYYVTPLVDAWHGNPDETEIQWENKKKA
ncbi:MAG: hypothetical protein BA863_01760 [Desulfovibrio sp. S3730MH75]|nr:MAG: hypothetical protein BA863_01760 [Desulfovibrio sp. S3730MH75]